MPEDVLTSLPKGTKIVSESDTLKSLPKDIKIINADVPKVKNPYFEDINKEKAIDSVDNFINALPDTLPGGDTQKKILKDLALKGTPINELKDAFLTMSGRHPYQESGVIDINANYYYNDKGLPVPLKSNERPPKGYDIANDLHGTQEDVDKRGLLKSAGAHIYNGIWKGAIGMAGLANLPYAMATGKDADWYEGAKNTVESFLQKTPEYETKDQFFDAKDMKEIGDFFDIKRYKVNAGILQGQALNGLESLTSFILGTKGAGAVGEIVGAGAEGAGLIAEGGGLSKFLAGTTSGGQKAQAFQGSYAITFPDVDTYVKDAGLEGRERVAVSSAITVPVAALEMMFGTEGLFVKNAVAKQAKANLIKGLVDGVVRNADGTMSKELLADTFKATVLEATKLNKSFARDVAENIGEEAATEGLQDFTKQGLAKMYDHLSQQENFKKDPLSFESFGEYWNSMLSGAAGAAGPSTAATIQKRNIEIQKKQNENIYNTVQKGDDAVKALKLNIDKAVKDGEITTEQGADAIIKVDAYDTYNKQTTGLKLGDEDKKRVFELTFEKANLDSKIPTDYEAEKLNGIQQAQIDVRKKQSKHIQDEINKIVLREDVQNTTTPTAKKTEEEVAKDIEAEKELESLRKTKIKSQEMKDVMETETPSEEKYIIPEAVKNETRSYEEIPLEQWNDPKFNTRVKQAKFAELVDKLPNKNTFGVIQQDNVFEDSKNNKIDTFNVTLPDGKTVRFASSMKRKPAKDEKGGYRGNTYEENFDNRDNPIGASVGIKAVTLKDSGRKVLFIYNNEPGLKKGKHIGMVKESLRGNSNYSKADLDEMADLRMTNMAEPEGGEKVEVTPEVPIVPADVKFVSPKVILGQPTRDNLRTRFIEDKIKEEVKDKGYYHPSLDHIYEKKYGRIYDKYNPVKETKEVKTGKEDVLSAVRKYNELNKKAKKSESGVSLYNKINEEAEKMGYSTQFTPSGKLQLLNPSGKIVYKEPVKRTKEQIDEAKNVKAKEKSALNAIPADVDHAVALAIANGVMFNKDEFLAITGLTKEKLPLGLFVNEGGQSFEFFKLYIEELGGNVSEDESAVANEAAGIIGAKYLGKDFRQIAKDEVVSNYEKQQNGGLTDAELSKYAEEYGEKATGVIVDAVNNLSEEELDENINKIENAENKQEASREIISEHIGEEKTFDNPFDEEFEEWEKDESDKGIVSKKEGDEDVFQKSQELQYAEGELKKAEAELKGAKKAFDAKRKELDKGIIEDQEDLFGERQSTDETSLFDERADVNGRNQVVLDLKAKFDKATKDYLKWQTKVKSLEDAQDSQTSLFQKRTAKKGDVEKIVAKLKISMPNIKVVFDENLKAAGKWSPSTKTITINPYHAGLDTPIHEYGHVLIDAIGYNNKVIQAAIKQLKSTPLWAETKERYKELDEENLGKEVLAEAIGREGADIFEKESDKSKFKTYLDYIFDWLKTKLGLNKNIAKSLAKQVIGGVGTKEMVGKNESEQLQKTKETDEEKAQRKAETKQRVKEQRAAINEITSGEEIKNLPFDKLIELYNHVIGFEKSVKDKYFNDIKTQIAYRLFTDKKAELQKWADEGKVKGYSEEEANKSDIKDKDVLLKSLSHMSQVVPELQVFSKMFESTFFDMTAERYKLKNELEKLGKAVIKERNEKLGLKRFLTVFNSDSAKYFDFVENPKAILKEDKDGKEYYDSGYWTVEEGKAKGFTKAQLSFLEYLHKLNDLRNEQLAEQGSEEGMDDVLKVDKSVSEALFTEGALQALSLFLGNGFNLRNIRVNFTDPITNKTETMNYGAIEQKLLSYGKKGTLEYLNALRLLAKYNMAAKRQLRKRVNVDDKDNEFILKGGSAYQINPYGSLDNKFLKSRNKDRGFSRDFYKAAFNFIDDYTHSKHMSELLPYIDSIEYINKVGYLEHAAKDNVGKWVEDWKKLHLFQTKEVGPLGPEVDASVRLLRSLTSMIVMAFNVPAAGINALMGQYNNLKAESAELLAKGHERLLVDSKRGEGAAGKLVSKKAADILKKYQVISIDYDSNPKLFAGKLFDNIAHGLTRAGEFYIQGSMFLGLMSEEDFNSFEYVKNENGVEELVYTGKDEKALKERMIKNKNRVSDIQGKYSSKDQRNFMAGEFGKMVAQFKVWVPDWWKERFGDEYITADGETKKGTYRSFNLQALKDLKQQFDEKGFKEAVWDNKTAMSNLKGALAVAVLLSIKMGGDDDEKKRKQGNLLSQLTSNVLFIFDPTGLKFTVTQPVAAMNTVGKFVDVLSNSMEIDGGFELTLDKAGKKAMKAVPYTKLITPVIETIVGED